MTLKIYLLGQFLLQRDDLPLELPSRPAQSLLAYLVINPGIPHRREKLSGMLWPDSEESNARGYLRQALWRIRKSIESGSLNPDDFLDINKISITWIKESDFWVDASGLMKPEENLSPDDLIEIVRLYQGELLPGFYEDWIQIERDRLQAAHHQKMTAVLDTLIEAEDWERALEWSEHWIRTDISPEQAYRALMIAYHGMGDTAMLRNSYERCEDALNRDLGVEPSEETQELYRRLQSREQPIHQPIADPCVDLPVQLPPFLEERDTEWFERPLFLARESELAQLETYLRSTLSNKGQTVFITGEAGSGKTSLLDEFTRRSIEEHSDLVVVSGNCNAHTGMGDPYLPFREILGQLSGDVEARLEAGTITTEHARRLWNMIPCTTSALVESGPDLINTFINGPALIDRMHVISPGRLEWVSRLEKISKDRGTTRLAPGIEQYDFFDQYTRVLREISRTYPLILQIDDLQWADAGSIGLLFHLGRQITGCPILIVGAYRQEEVALGRDGARHPLEPVLNELQREYGLQTLNLEHSDRMRFVEALLASEPNQLGPEFQAMLFQQTQGQPLFTIELLRGMQERGDLELNDNQEWIEGEHLDWETMPARVEAVIAERIGRLDPPSQALLRAASVEGEVFTAEAVAQVIKRDDRELLACLSSELDRQHRLVRADSIHRSDGQLLSSYRFRNILFQKYLYNSLDEVERIHLHEEIGEVLETLISSEDQAAEMALKLARHFEEAGMLQQAIHYLHLAGERATQLCAFQEGTAHLWKAVELLRQNPESPQRDQEELQLLISIVKTWKNNWGSTTIRQAFDRASQLCHQLESKAELARIQGELTIYHYVQAEYPAAIECAVEALDLAQQAEDPILIAASNWYLGFLNFGEGNYVIGKDYLEKVREFYDPQEHHRTMLLYHGVDAGTGALAYEALCLWCLGYPDQGIKRSTESISIAKQLGHPFSIADAMCYGGCMFNAMLLDGDELYRIATELVSVADQERLSLSGWLGMGKSYLGEAQIILGQTQSAIETIREGIDIFQATDVHLYRVIALRSLARAYLQAGDHQNAMVTLDEAMAIVEEIGERCWEPDLHRLHALILIQKGDFIAAEACFEKSIEVAQHQQAKSWELRTMIDLARWYQREGKTTDARKRLGETYEWFTEGFSTPDLLTAKSLLEELA